MYKHLYDTFAYWYKNVPWGDSQGNRDGSIYFYGDPHFGDEESTRFRNDPRFNMLPGEEITPEFQIRRINAKVTKRDTLVILGDVGDPSYMDQIRAGHKVLIKGNHDAGNVNYQPYFDEIFEGPLFISEKILLSHEPIPLPFALNIHGHVHFDNEESTASLGASYRVNACADSLDMKYTPISLKEIVERGYLSKIDSLHRTTTTTATLKKLRSERGEQICQ